MNGNQVESKQWFLPSCTPSTNVLSCSSLSNENYRFQHSFSAYPAVTINLYSYYDVFDCSSHEYSCSTNNLCYGTPLVYDDNSPGENKYPSNCYLFEVGSNVFAPFRVKTPDDYLRSYLASLSCVPSPRSPCHSDTNTTKNTQKKIGNKKPRHRKNFDSRIKARVLELYNSLIRSSKRCSIRMIAESICDTMRKEE